MTSAFLDLIIRLLKLRVGNWRKLMVIMILSRLYLPHKVAFGKGPTAWSNCVPTQLIIEHKAEIEKFGRVPKTCLLLSLSA